jgi:hypothetical protein
MLNQTRGLTDRCGSMFVEPSWSNVSSAIEAELVMMHCSREAP